jgi:hypothetical protein
VSSDQLSGGFSVGQCNMRGRRSPRETLSQDIHAKGALCRTTLLGCKIAKRFVLSLLRLFDHLVGERQEGFRDRQPKRLGGFKIDDKIEFIRLFYWNIAGVRSAQNLVHQIGGASELIQPVWSIRHKTSRRREIPNVMHRGQPLTECPSVDFDPNEACNSVGTDVEGLRAAFERLQGGRDIASSPDFQASYSKAELSRRTLNFAHLQHDFGVIDIAQNRELAEMNDNLAQKFDALAGEVGCLSR